MKYYIFQDWTSNVGNIKARFVLVLFRAAKFVRTRPMPVVLILSPYLFFYRIFVEWLLAIELPWGVDLGPGAKIYHGFGLVVHANTKIGKNVILRHNTTIGLAHTNIISVPIIGDNVDIGSNVVILGDISIGNNSIIGAGSVVTKSIPPNCIVVGNPARIIKHI